ncbi:MAG: zinc ribbon domain-containing protein [Bacteroidales bacterium]
MRKMAKTQKKELTAEDKLKAMYDLQVIMSEVDQIKVLRGELPLEVADLEDAIEGLETRIGNINESISTVETDMYARRNAIQESNSLIEKYTDQQDNVRNNREFDSLTKEIEFQNLEIQLAEKHIKKYEKELEELNKKSYDSQAALAERQAELEDKKNELANIVAETEKDEEKLRKSAEKLEAKIEERLLTAFKRIRKNAKNGIAVATVERDACGGCYNRITPQRQLDVASHTKIIVCEYCGRILVDKEISGEIEKTEE